MKIYAENKKVKFDYDILATYEAGLVLLGHEVKSIKTGHISLKGAFVVLKQVKNKNLPEVYLINCFIPAYKNAGKLENYNPEQSRKILIKSSEIKQLIGKIQEKGLTLVPIKVYNKHKLIKLEFGIGRGKKKIDKRETIKKRYISRKLQRIKKQY